MSADVAIIGDIHGELEPFERLQSELIAAHSGVAPFLVLTGDLVDRGSDSAGVIRTVREGVTEGRIACVLGNHDEMFLISLLLFRRDLVRLAGVDLRAQEALVGAFRFAPSHMLNHWIQQGGGATIRSYGGVPGDPVSWNVPPEDIAFLASLPLIWQNDRIVVTHARADGTAIREAETHLHAPWRISEQSRTTLLWNREGDAPDDGRLYISGHTPRELPHAGKNSLEIDTGCVFGNKLTAYLPGKDSFISVACTE